MPSTSKGSRSRLLFVGSLPMLRLRSGEVVVQNCVCGETTNKFHVIDLYGSCGYHSQHAAEVSANNLRGRQLLVASTPERQVPKSHGARAGKYSRHCEKLHKSLSHPTQLTMQERRDKGALQTPGSAVPTLAHGHKRHCGRHHSAPQAQTTPIRTHDPRQRHQQHGWLGEHATLPSHVEAQSGAERPISCLCRACATSTLTDISAEGL